MKTITTTLLLLASLAFVTNGTFAAISPIGPFTGNLTETFESFGETALPSGVLIMNGNASLTVASNNHHMYAYPAGVGLGSSGPAQVSDGTNGLFLTYAANGIYSATAIVAWSSPVSRFGGYFSAATGSGEPIALTDPALVTVKFYGVTGLLVDEETFPYSHSATNDGGLDWHGWTNTVPIGSVSITANYGFFDGFQATALPIDNPALKIGTAIELGWLSESNKNYQVQFRTNLNSIWHNFGVPVPGDGTILYMFDTTRSDPQRFYRVISAP